MSEQADRLRTFVRDSPNFSGGCRMLSLGSKCQCPLCDVDALDALVSGKNLTFDKKLVAMISDLTSIAHRLNKDGQPDIATNAQNCINAVSALRERNRDFFDDLNWDWEPIEEE